MKKEEHLGENSDGAVTQPIIVNYFVFLLSQIKSPRKFEVLQLARIRMSQRSKNKTFFKLPVEIALVIRLVST